MTKTRAILKKGVEPKIQHPTGILDKQINADDLVANPEKYVNVYPGFYENLGAISHEVNTRSRVSKSLGKKTRVLRSKANNGVVYNVFVGNPKQKKQAITRSLNSLKSMSEKSIEAKLKSKDDMIAKLQAELEAAHKKPKSTSRRKKSDNKSEENKSENDN